MSTMRDSAIKHKHLSALNKAAGFFFLPFFMKCSNSMQIILLLIASWQVPQN